jgi:hypothetical protein
MGGGDPLILSLSGYHEGHIGSGPGMEQQLPESGGEVDGCEDNAARSANVTDAFAHILCEVFISLGMDIESSEILDKLDVSALLGCGKDPAVELAAG